MAYNLCVCIVFQFHKGTIKTIWCNDRIKEMFNFNSIKVRLKPIAILRQMLEFPTGFRLQKYEKNVDIQ